MHPPPSLLSLLLFLHLHLSLYPSACWSSRIIVVPPIMFESHLYIFKTLATELHLQGHDTSLLLSEGRQVPPSPHYTFQRYPGIFNTSTADSFLQSKVSNIFSGRLTALELFDILDHYAQNCDAVVGNKEVMTQLKDADFDLLLVDPNEMCGFVIAHILGVPYAVFSTGLWYPAEVGAPAPLSYVPEFNSLLTDRMSLVQRIVNTAVYLVSRFGVQYLVLPKYERIMRKHGVEPRVAMQDLVQGSRLWMLSTDLALEFPRPTLPHVVYVGGILTKPASPLPQDYESWVNDTAEHGFVVVSFGAGVKYLSEDITHKLAGALGRLPQRVVWRYCNGPNTFPSISRYCNGPNTFRSISRYCNGPNTFPSISRYCNGPNTFPSISSVNRLNYILQWMWWLISVLSNEERQTYHTSFKSLCLNRIFISQSSQSSLWLS
ncbi:2-hydroxyacylsphingosine 1-beta-galactosyltransferase-like, partial [Salmo salar]|uniref:2-hydroxyacylsphingosine 1-beta-galactosyltransferase-like n=1 Tax=Salmo salar TaxID=8030 RepID=A0ABM3EFD4_SALSA